MKRLKEFGGLMYLIIITLFLAFLAMAIYFGAWRAFFFTLGSIFPILLLFPKIRTMWQIWLCFFIWLLIALTFRTFFIHGVKKTNQKSALKYAIEKYSFYAGVVVIALVSTGYLVQLLRIGAQHEIVNFLNMGIGVPLFIVFLFFIIGWTLITLVNHFSITKKYVETLTPGEVEEGVRLRTIRYLGKKKPVQLYALENIYGRVYYLRKAKAKDQDVLCENRFTRFVQKFEDTHTVPEKARWTVRQLMCYIVLLILWLGSGAQYIDTTPELKYFFNAQIFARNYKTVQGKLVEECSNYQINTIKHKYRYQTVYKMSCQIQYDSFQKPIQIERTDFSEFSNVMVEIRNKGLPMHYNLSHPEQSYTELDKKNEVGAVFFYGITAGIVLGILKQKAK